VQRATQAESRQVEVVVLVRNWPLRWIIARKQCANSLTCKCPAKSQHNNFIQHRVTHTTSTTPSLCRVAVGSVCMGVVAGVSECTALCVRALWLSFLSPSFQESAQSDSMTTGPHPRLHQHLPSPAFCRRDDRERPGLCSAPRSTRVLMSDWQWVVAATSLDLRLASEREREKQRRLSGFTHANTPHQMRGGHNRYLAALPATSLSCYNVLLG
jgi:hypothetical protein